MELPEDVVLAAVLRVFPRAEVGSDNDGQFVIYTNCMWSGKNGEFVLGEMSLSDADVLDKINLLLSARDWPGASGMEDVLELVRTVRSEIPNAPEWPRH